MYTVNLKDIQLEQELPDKQFENEDKYKLIDEVSAYVSENHSETFPNPVTLSRKIDEAIKNADGLTQKESIEHRGEEIMNEIEQQAAVKKTATAPIREKYEKMIAESKEKFDIERSALLEEQVATREEEVIEAIQLKLDNNTHEAQQDFERLLKEQSEAVASTEAKLES
jgi:hypothetical protein